MLDEQLLLLVQAIGADIKAMRANVPFHYVPPGLASGSFITNGINGGALSTIAGSAGRLELVPFMPSSAITINRLAIEVSTLLAASQARIGIYDSDALGNPRNLITGAGALLDCATTGSKVSDITPALALAKGETYWLAVLFSSTQTVRAIALASLLPLAATETGTGILTVRRATATFASGLPSAAPATTLTSAIAPRVVMRKA